jgi:hypothetical protein
MSDKQIEFWKVEVIVQPKLEWEELLESTSAVVPERVTEIKGFASSAGVVEGTTRVCIVYEDIKNVQPGEILVCPDCCQSAKWDTF